MSLPVYITDIFRDQIIPAVNDEVLTAIRANETAATGKTKIEVVSFETGVVTELTTTLSQKDTPTERNRKYPFIYLQQPFTEHRGHKAGIYTETEGFFLYIIHHSLLDFKITDREAKVLKPVLQPIYVSLLKQIARNTGILESNVEMIDHRFTFLPLLGSEKKEGNKLNDYVDAIELSNIKLNFYIKTC